MHFYLFIYYMLTKGAQLQRILFYSKTQVFSFVCFCFASFRVLFRLQTGNFFDSTIGDVTIPYRKETIKWMGNSSHLFGWRLLRNRTLRNIISWARQFSISLSRLLSFSLCAFACSFWQQLILLPHLKFLWRSTTSICVKVIEITALSVRCYCLAALYRHTKLTGSR